jgi:ferredoxin-type protein NapH
VPCSATEAGHGALQHRRRATQIAFFGLFLAAPALDLLRFDLHQAQLWVLGRPWTLGIDAFVQGRATATDAALGILLRGIVPVLLLAAAFLAVAWRWGRVYCGWLCPHFSLVELLNDLLHRACGRLSLWDAGATPIGGRQPQRRWWPVWAASCVAFGGLWSVTLLTYLLPPDEIWSGLLHASLTPNQTRFVVIGAALFSAELMFARHLFCRFGCAVGFFQSLAWMANPKALVMSFDRARAADCRDCHTARAPQGSACDSACPMRLQPRRVKRLMFACVQCGRCARECATSHAAAATPPNLSWRVGADALRETLRQRRADDAARPAALAHPGPAATPVVSAGLSIDAGH